jgi:hypothetical protein
MGPWPDDVDAFITGDIPAAAAYVTPAGGTVVTGVAPCGLSDPAHGTVGFTTSLGFGRKLDRIVRDPHVALAYHARDHGFSADPRFVLAQGTADVDLTPSRERLEAFAPQATRYLGEMKHGPVWDRVLREYYADRVFVDVAVERVAVWPTLGGDGDPAVYGTAIAAPAPPQKRPENGSGPRVDVAKVAGQLSTLPHRLLGFRGGDGYPVIVPVQIGGHDAAGLRLVVAPGLVPPGGRRAGLLAHSYRPHLVGLASRTLTGWIEVDDGGGVRYAPHTSKGFLAPPNKPLLLVSNGLLAKYGLWQARRKGVLQTLQEAQAEARP